MVLRVVSLWPLGLDLRHPLRRVRAAPRPVLPRRVPDTQGPGHLVVRPNPQRRRRRSNGLKSFEPTSSVFTTGFCTTYHQTGAGELLFTAWRSIGRLVLGNVMVCRGW